MSNLFFEEFKYSPSEWEPTNSLVKNKHSITKEFMGQNYKIVLCLTPEGKNKRRFNIDGTIYTLPNIVKFYFQVTNLTSNESDVLTRNYPIINHYNKIKRRIMARDDPINYMKLVYSDWETIIGNVENGIKLAPVIDFEHIKKMAHKSKPTIEDDIFPFDFIINSEFDSDSE